MKIKDFKNSPSKHKTPFSPAVLFFFIALHLIEMVYLCKHASLYMFGQYKCSHGVFSLKMVLDGKRKIRQWFVVCQVILDLKQFFDWIKYLFLWSWAVKRLTMIDHILKVWVYLIIYVCLLCIFNLYLSTHALIASNDLTAIRSNAIIFLFYFLNIQHWIQA